MKQYIVDAFTDRPFSGNPAAVCVMEKWPPEQGMKNLAMENNLSETAFIVKEGEDGEEVTVPIEAATEDSKQTVIYESDRAFPFILTVSFRNACLFRYRIDRNAKTENHYTSNSSPLSLTAQNGIRLWTSNINALRIQVAASTQNISIEIGPAGHVLVEDIKWVYGNDGKYRLVIEEIN